MGGCLSLGAVIQPESPVLTLRAQVRFQEGGASLLGAAGPLLPVPGMVVPLCVCPDLLFLADPSLTGLGPTLVTSSYLTHLFSPVSTYSHVRRSQGLGIQHEFGSTIPLITLNKNKMHVLTF